MPTACPKDTGHCMDFGSILRFVESNWGLGNIGGPGVSYADVSAKPIDPGFFSLYPNVRTFQYVRDTTKTQMDFITYSDTPIPPDNDADE